MKFFPLSFEREGESNNDEVDPKIVNCFPQMCYKSGSPLSKKSENLKSTVIWYRLINYLKRAV
jgi:hypothetical protein